MENQPNENHSDELFDDELSKSSYTSENDENYVFKANLCTILSKELQLPETIYDNTGNYDQPKEHGLTNSDYIIPSYYKKNKNNILDVDYYEIIKDDIRNFRSLNKYQIEYIMNLEDKYKNELIIMFNYSLKVFSEILCK